MAERTILMTIIEADAGFTGRIALDGETLGAERALPPEHATAIRGMAEALGAVLHDIWFAPLWTLLAQRLGTGGERILTVASDCPAILNLPWELWRPQGGDCVGTDPAPLFLDRSCAESPRRGAAAGAAPRPLHGLRADRPTNPGLRARGGDAAARADPGTERDSGRER